MEASGASYTENWYKETNFGNKMHLNSFSSVKKSGNDNLNVLNLMPVPCAGGGKVTNDFLQEYLLGFCILGGNRVNCPTFRE